MEEGRMTNKPSNKMIPTNTDWTNLWEDPQTEIDLSKLKDTNKSPMDIHETIRVYLANRFGFKDPDEFDTAIDNNLDKFVCKVYDKEWYENFHEVKAAGYKNIIQQGPCHPLYKIARGFKKQFDEASKVFRKE